MGPMRQSDVADAGGIADPCNDVSLRSEDEITRKRVVESCSDGIGARRRCRRDCCKQQGFILASLPT
jgi:hypothetical protein